MNNAFDENTIKQICKRHSFRINQATRLSTGKFNYTYVCDLQKPDSAQNDKIIVRIAPSDTEGFVFYEKNMMAQEPEIHSIVKKYTSIPIPEIYVYDDSKSVINRNFLIMEYIQGKPLSDMELSSDGIKKVMFATGKYLRQLHERCQRNKYGYLGAHNCMEPENSWSNAFKVMWEKLVKDVEWAGVYSRKEADYAGNMLNDYIHLFDKDIPASLLHMDIWSQNILVDDLGNITSIVDWDRGLWGDPEIEFAVLDYCGFNNDDFWRGYGKAPVKSKEVEIRMAFYHLYEVQKYLIIWTMRGGDRSKISEYKAYSLKKLTQIT